MRLKLKSDFKELQRFLDRLEHPERALDLVARNMSDEALDLIVDGMRRGVDPYGKRYARLKLRSGRPLLDTGRLRSSWHRKRVDSRGFRIASGVAYARYHQSGTGIYGPSRSPIVPKRAKTLAFKVRGESGMRFPRSVKGSPARKMIPDKKLPARWRKALIAAGEEALRVHFGG